MTYLCDTIYINHWLLYSDDGYELSPARDFISPYGDRLSTSLHSSPRFVLPRCCARENSDNNWHSKRSLTGSTNL
ncbi:hypothetical protein V8C34DRAFT_74385 [Trichoderma compactum]